MAAHPAVVDGVAEDVLDAHRLPGLGGELLVADRTDGIPLEERDGLRDGSGIDLENMGWSICPAEAEWRQPTLVAVCEELRAVAIGDPHAQLAAVPLGRGGLADELLPLALVG